MLTNNEIKKQIQNGKIIIKNMSDDALEKPNSCKVHLSDVLYTYDYSVVDAKYSIQYLEEVKNGKVNILNTIKIPENGLLLEPGKVYLTKTIEQVQTKDYIPVLNGRTSLSLLGLSIELNNGYTVDEYDGNLILCLICTKPTIIYPWIEIGNLTFFPSLNNTSTQKGMLSGKEIIRRINIGDIFIDNHDFLVINPNSINLSLNKKIGFYKEPIIDILKENEIQYLEINENGTFLYPDKIYVARTNEWTETYNLIPMISGRSSLGRLGFHVHCSGGMGSIGYKGYWHLGIRTTLPIIIYENMKCCQIYFYTPEGEITNHYQGSMQQLSGNELGSQMHRTLKKD